MKIHLGDESPIHTNPVTARRRSESGPKTPTLRGRNIDVGVFRCRTVPKLPPPLSRLFSADRAGTPFRWGSTVTAKWPARGHGFGAAPPKKPSAGVRGRSPRLDGGGYQQSEGYVSETAPLRSYSVKFFLSPFTCCRAWYSYSVKFPLSPFAPGCSQVFGLDTSILVCTTSLCKSEATV